MSNIVFINWHNRKNILNGPTNVFQSLVKEIRSEDSITVISPESGFRDFPRLLERLKKELSSKEKKSFLINSDGLKLPLHILMISKFYKRHKFFLLYHGLRKEEDKLVGICNKKYYFLEKLVLRNFENVITVSSLTRELIKGNYNRKKPSYVIYNGVEVDKTKDESIVKAIEKEIRLIASGGLKEIKGIEDMISMVTFINSQNNDFRVKLTIYGDYDNEDFYKKVMEIINVSEDIKYGGTVTKDELYEQYKNSHFTLSLSKLDSFNLSVIEGMLYGAPPILNKRVGACEIIGQMEEGFIIEEKNYSSINKFFQEVYKNNEKYSIMVSKCYEKAKKFTWEKTLREYIKLLYSGN